MRGGQCRCLMIGELNSSIGRAVSQLERLISIILNQPQDVDCVRRTRCFISWKLEASSEEGQLLMLMLGIRTLLHGDGDIRKRDSDLIENLPRTKMISKSKI